MNVVIMAGGTGGHIFPAAAVADALKKTGANIQWLGSVRGMEQGIVEKMGYPFCGLPVSAWHGGFIRKLIAPINLVLSLAKCFVFFRQTKPDVVVGFGGYPSAPGGLMASWMKIPLVLHEQNGTPGLTNKKLASRADLVLQAFPNTFEENYPVVGNPVRKTMASMTLPSSRTRAEEARLKVLVLGGSSGAQAINELMPKVAKLLPLKLKIWHQTGKGKKTLVSQGYEQPDTTVTEFIDNMTDAYKWADIVVARSGASTVSELAAVGLPSILIPYPWHKDKQQYRNADWLCAAGCAQWFEQDTLTAEHLAAQLQYWYEHREELLNQADAAWHIGLRDSAEIIVEHIKSVVEGKRV